MTKESEDSRLVALKYDDSGKVTIINAANGYIVATLPLIVLGDLTGFKV